DPTMPMRSRKGTVVAPQALLMMYDELVMDSAESPARQISDHSHEDAQRITRAYTLALGRPANAHEIDRAIEFVQRARKSFETEPAMHADHRLAHRDAVDAELAAWALFCQSLFASNEFIYLQ
ncbi:MAG: DUF1553 domain-containing protein, partial [Planctomycetaceae bacterium]